MFFLSGDTLLDEFANQFHGVVSCQWRLEDTSLPLPWTSRVCNSFRSSFFASLVGEMFSMLCEHIWGVAAGLQKPQETLVYRWCLSASCQSNEGQVMRYFSHILSRFDCDSHVLCRLGVVDLRFLSLPLMFSAQFPWKIMNNYQSKRFEVKEYERMYMTVCQNVVSWFGW